MAKEETTKTTRDQTKDASQRAWEETMRKRAIGRPGEVVQEMNVRAGELMEPEAFAEAVHEGAGGALAAGAAMTGIKTTPFASAEPATDFYVQEGPGKPTGFTAQPGDPQYESARDVGQETMQVTREAAKERLRMNIIGASRMAAEGKEHKHLTEEAIRQARAAGMTPAEIQAAQLEGERVAKLMRSERGMPRYDELRYRAQTPAEPMGTYHAEALQSVEPEKLRAYDPLAKERIAAGKDIRYLPTSEFGAHLAGEGKLKGTRGGQAMTPAVPQAEPDVVEQMDTRERKGKADPRFRGGTVPEGTKAGDPWRPWEPPGPVERTPPIQRALGIDAMEGNQTRSPKDIERILQLQQRQQKLTALAASQAARDRSRSLDERPARYRRAAEGRYRPVEFLHDGTVPQTHSDTMAELTRVKQELAELLAEPKARGEEASKKAAGKTRTYKGTGKPKPGIESLPSRQGMEVGKGVAYDPLEASRGAAYDPLTPDREGFRPAQEGRTTRSPLGRTWGRPGMGAGGAAGLAAMAAPLLIAGGEGLKALLGKPEGDEIFIEMSRQMGGPLSKGALNKETMEAFKSSPNEVSRFLQAGIFSPELARELAPGRVRGTKQAAKNAYEKSQREE